MKARNRTRWAKNNNESAPPTRTRERVDCKEGVELLNSVPETAAFSPSGPSVAIVHVGLSYMFVAR